MDVPEYLPKQLTPPANTAQANRLARNYEAYRAVLYQTTMHPESSEAFATRLLSQASCAQACYKCHVCCQAVTCTYHPSAGMRPGLACARLTKNCDCLRREAMLACACGKPGSHLSLLEDDAIGLSVSVYHYSDGRDETENSNAINPDSNYLHALCTSHRDGRFFDGKVTAVDCHAHAVKVCFSDGDMGWFQTWRPEELVRMD